MTRDDAVATLREGVIVCTRSLEDLRAESVERMTKFRDRLATWLADMESRTKGKK